MAHRTLFTLLLACSLLIPLVSPNVVSQNVVSSYQSSMASLTTTMYSTIMTSSETSGIVHYDLTPGDYDTRTGSFTLSFTVLDSTNFYGDWGDRPCLFYDYFLLNATSDQTIHFHFQLSMEGRAIDFLILNPGQFWKFEHSNCGWGLTNPILHVYGSSLNVDWVVPESGQYALVFATPVFYGGQVYYSAQEYSTVVQNQTSTSTATSIFEVTYTILSTPTSTQSLSTPTSIGSGNLAFQWFVPVILILAIGVGVALMLRKRR